MNSFMSVTSCLERLTNTKQRELLNTCECYATRSYACILTLFVYSCIRLSEALRAADPHIELAGSNGRYTCKCLLHVLHVYNYTRKCRLIKMFEAMTDMCAFTQLTDDIFGYIRISRDDSLRQVLHACTHSNINS